MASVEAFKKSVLKSKLLTSEQLEESLRSVAANDLTDPQALADNLVRQGKLSRFQAEKLLNGAPLGLVLGPYQVLAPVGKGGMGTVYLARDLRTRKLLALKILPPRRAREEERMLARFRREMELCQRVSHIHLTQTYEVGVEQGVNYIAMEFLPGKSLYRLVMEEGPITVARAARLFCEAALALDHAHRRGLIHRDMKPSNIMVSPNDHAKVLDLGLALIEGETAVDREVIGGQGYVVGTMDYVPPEQANDPTRVDARSDIYALGCTLYFALAGRPPFPGGGKLEKLEAHRTRQPEPLTSLNPAVPAEFAALVHKMMAKLPAERFPSALDVLNELRPWVGEAPALPLDRPNDSSYRRAVLKLEGSSPAPELAREAIPVAAVAEPTTHSEIVPTSSETILPAPTYWRELWSAGTGTLPLSTWLLAGMLVLFFLMGAVFLTWLFLQLLRY